jgi:toxin ParE1/3/4
MVERIRTAVARLGASPALGRPGRVAGTRELVIPRTPYIVPYRAKGDVVQIVTILHSAQRWPDRLPSRVCHELGQFRIFGGTSPGGAG